MKTRVKNSDELKAMRESGKMLSAVLELLIRSCVSGVTTKELANLAKQELRKLGGQPTFLGYQGYRDVLCVSVNDEVVHGLPSDARVVKKGDIVSMDFGVTYKGMVTDAARSVLVEDNDSQKLRLINATLQSLDAGIETLKDGVRTGSIGEAIEAVLNKNSLGIVRDFVGHGVGHHMHEEPNIPNYGRANTGPSLAAGMTIAIEPMATLGGDDVYIDVDGWTVKTNDGSLAAHFEDTVLICEDGYEILTRSA